MFPLLGGLLSGGASLLSSIFSSNTSAQNTQAQIQAQQASQQETEAFNANQAQLNRDFQAGQVSQQEQFQNQMSSTAYQRASADMKAAGLNPMMMFGSGSAASSPSGSAASGSTASVGTPTVPMPQNTSPLAGLGAAVSRGLDSAITAKTLDKMTDEIANLQASRGLTTAATDVEREKALTQAALTHKTSYEATGAQLDLGQKRVGATSASDILSMPEDVRQGIVRGKFQDPHFGGVVGGLVGAGVGTAKAVGRYFRGDSFSDRFDAVYGNSQ